MNKEEKRSFSIGIDYGQGESQSALSREIEMLEVKNNIDNGIDLATRTYRVYDYIMDSIKEYGEISQFKEDVLYIIHGLLEKQLPQKELTATQIVIKNRDMEMQIEKEKYLRKELEQKESILDKVTEFANKTATENAEKYNSENQKEVDFSEWNLALEILNIIEGEKK